RWKILEYSQPSPWVTEGSLKEAKKRNPPGRFLRLWYGVWTPDESDPALKPEDIAAAFRDGLLHMRVDETGWLFCTGVVLGVSRDFSAVTTLAVPAGGVAGHIRMATHKVWKPAPGSKVDLMEVERYVLGLDQQYQLQFVGF